MNNQPSKKTIDQVVADEIKAGKAKMRPKSHFVLEGVLLGLVTAIALLAALYFASFILFLLARSGLWFLPRYGLMGTRLFLGGFPWFFFLLVIAFVFIIGALIRRRGVIYRKPLIYLILLIFSFVIIAGLVVQQTTFHKRIYQGVQKRGMPLARLLYYQLDERPSDKVHSGIVSEVSNGGLVIVGHNQEALRVLISSETQLPVKRRIQEGDQVVVIGGLKDGVIQALGIHKLPPRLNGLRPLK